MGEPFGQLVVQDARGSVQAEYVVVLTLVSLVLASSIAGLGLLLFRLCMAQQAWLLLPIG